MSAYSFLMPYYLALVVLCLFYLAINIFRYAIGVIVQVATGLFNWISNRFTNPQPKTPEENQQVPGAKHWISSVMPGIKLVARHGHAQPRRRSLAVRPSFWIVTVLEIQGYFARARYLGMERDGSRDAWIHLGKHEIYPVGGEMRMSIFMPPHYGKEQDWRNYFVTQLSGKATLGFDFLPRFHESLRASKYKNGDLLEVLDKYNISQFRVGRVSKIIGRRLYLRYLDENNEDGFFCHEQSPSIHSMGWAKATGHQIKTTSMYHQSKTEASDPRFVGDVVDGLELKVGMKLEAVDPLCPSRICAATICKVLEFGNIMVKMDCYDDQDTKNDNGMNGHSNKKGNSINNNGFCYHFESPYIFNCGFCKTHGISIAPPVGYEENNFDWNSYFEEHADLAVASLAEKPKIKHGFKSGMKLEMADVMNPTKIHPATIVRVVGRLLRISFDGWEPVYDQWLDAESPDIYPIGWCALVGHALEAPIPPTQHQDQDG